MTVFSTDRVTACNRFEGLAVTKNALYISYVTGVTGVTGKYYNTREWGVYVIVRMLYIRTYRVRALYKESRPKMGLHRLQPNFRFKIKSLVGLRVGLQPVKPVTPLELTNGAHFGIVARDGEWSRK